MQINARSAKKLEEACAQAYAEICSYKDTLKRPKRKGPKPSGGRARNKGSGYKRPIVVICGQERFDFPSINSCANSKMFKCSPNSIRRFAESGIISGDRMVYYKDQLPEVLK